MNNVSFASSTRQVDADENIVVQLGDQYENMELEGIVVNALGATLVALAILVPWIVRCPTFRKGLPREGRHDPRLGDI